MSKLNHGFCHTDRRRHRCHPRPRGGGLRAEQGGVQSRPAACRPACSARASGSVQRLTVEEELRFLDQAYAQGGRTGLMLQTLLETGARASELVQLRVEDVSLAERVIAVRRGKGRQTPGSADPA